MLQHQHFTSCVASLKSEWGSGNTIAQLTQTNDVKVCDSQNISKYGCPELHLHTGDIFLPCELQVEDQDPSAP